MYYFRRNRTKKNMCNFSCECPFKWRIVDQGMKYYIRWQQKVTNVEIRTRVGITKNIIYFVEKIEPVRPVELKKLDC